MNNIVNKNVTHRNSFVVECKKCKCKKIRIEVEYATYRGENDGYFFVCNHCGFKRVII